MKTAIIYYSQHHGNTKKLAEAIAKENQVDLFDVTESKDIDFADYDVIGFASGIYFSKFNKKVVEQAEKIPKDKIVFLLYTAGIPKDSHTDAIAKIVEEKGSTVVGKYGCRGFDTYGPLKLVGGIGKGHPTADEMKKAVEMFHSLKMN